MNSKMTCLDFLMFLMGPFSETSILLLIRPGTALSAGFTCFQTRLHTMNPKPLTGSPAM